MKTNLISSFLWAICSLALWEVCAVTAQADTRRTQSIALVKGWNAVYLQVTPVNGDPSVIFANTPVTIATTFLAALGTVEFIQNPETIQWKKEGWVAWYAPERPDAFLSSLSTLSGNRAYLIFSQRDFTWEVAGEVTFVRPRWKSDSFNFIGFGLDAQFPPTFAKFFSGSAAHQPNRVYRLVNDQWTLVANPNVARMRAGEAYWIFCKGGSEFEGPLQLRFSGVEDIFFGGQGEASMALANRSPDPFSVKVETDGDLPLSYIVRGITEGRMDDLLLEFSALHQLPSLEPGQKTGLWLKLRRERMTQTRQSTLLKISTDSAVELWVPLTGTRSDLTVTGN